MSGQYDETARADLLHAAVDIYVRVAEDWLA